jgi:SAM-dependent methyltransferase
VYLKTVLKRTVPPRLLLAARSFTYRGLDVWDQLRGARDPMIPPKHLMYDASARDTRTFRENSREFLRHYIDLCALQPHESVLDVGSGVGRKTIALTEYLNEKGRYEGLEIVKKAVDWCTNAISSRHPNFRFTHIDVYNEFYNPTGKARPVEYVFPFEPETFDLVVLGSVFTHMRPADIAHYFAEIRRVMKGGGRCLITYFLLNAESGRLLEEGRSTLNFVHDFGDFLSTSRATPEVAVCLSETAVRRLYSDNQLTIAEPIRYGSWCGRPKFLSYQDIVVAYRLSEEARGGSHNGARLG